MSKRLGSTYEARNVASIISNNLSKARKNLDLLIGVRFDLEAGVTQLEEMSSEKVKPSVIDTFCNKLAKQFREQVSTCETISNKL